MRLLILLLALLTILALGAQAAAAQTPAAGNEPAVAADQPGEEAAAAPGAPEADPVGSITQLIDDIRFRRWRAAAALILSLLMVGWNWARKNVSWLKTRLAGDRAGAISVLVLALAGGLLAALGADATLDAKLIAGSLWTAVDAAGLFLLIKRILKPKPEPALPAETNA